VTREFEAGEFIFRKGDAGAEQHGIAIPFGVLGGALLLAAALCFLLPKSRRNGAFP
jgi:hypothetical protein